MKSIDFPVNGDWHGCYRKGWKGILLPDAYCHPAKFSFGLITKILNYLSSENLVRHGDTILDPFGGVGCGAISLCYGLNWLGVELEQSFVELGQENIALWESQYRGKLPNWTGQAILLQGDSRKLIKVLQRNGIEAVVSSPPYHNALNDGLSQSDRERYVELSRCGRSIGTGYGNADGQIANLPTGDLKAVITSSPFAGNSGGRGEASRNGIDAALFDRHQGGMVKGLGESNGNLGTMQPKQGDLKAIVASPPYAGGEKGHPSLGSVNKDNWGSEGTDIAKRRGGNGRYGDSDGQLGAMKAGGVKGVIGSPPYENSVNQSQGANDTEARIERMRQAGVDVSQKVNIGGPNSTYNQAQVYGDSDGQIGATSGDTFWSAARLILEQCYLLLPVGGVAVFVCKDFIKAGERIPFSQQWAELCMAIGFAPCAHFRAWQVKPGPVQAALIGEDVDHTKEYKSFFRRNSEKKGAPRIDWEDVLIFRKEPPNA